MIGLPDPVRSPSTGSLAALLRPTVPHQRPPNSPTTHHSPPAFPQPVPTPHPHHPTPTSPTALPRPCTSPHRPPTGPLPHSTSPLPLPPTSPPPLLASPHCPHGPPSAPTSPQPPPRPPPVTTPTAPHGHQVGLPWIAGKSPPPGLCTGRTRCGFPFPQILRVRLLLLSTVLSWSLGYQSGPCPETETPRALTESKFAN